jgi:pSer/pThr/pTyr-binding forkhead associated (FHA) protein
MSFTLSVVQGRPAGKSLIFPVGDYFIGRGAECHVRPDSDLVSRQHCLLRVTGQSAFLRDLGSRNGTLVNGVLLGREQQLQNGDRVQLGPLVFEVQFDQVRVTDPVDPMTQTDETRMDATAELPTFKLPGDEPTKDQKSE